MKPHTIKHVRDNKKIINQDFQERVKMFQDLVKLYEWDMVDIDLIIDNAVDIGIVQSKLEAQTFIKTFKKEIFEEHHASN